MRTSTNDQDPLVVVGRPMVWDGLPLCERPRTTNSAKDWIYKDRLPPVHSPSLCSIYQLPLTLG